MKAYFESPEHVSFGDIFRAFRMIQLENIGVRKQATLEANSGIKPKKFYMVKVLSKLKRNSDLKKRVGIIGTTAGNMNGNMNRQTILMMFLLHECSDEVFNTRNARIQCFKQKELESSSFKHKLENPEVLTVNVLSLGRAGLDFKDIKDVLMIIKKEADPVISLLLIDAEKRSSDADQAILGLTLGDQLGAIHTKHAGNPEQLYKAAHKVLIDRKRAIAKCLEELESSTEKGIATRQHALTFASLKSKQDINLLHLIGHQNPDPEKRVDIIFQKHIHEKGNVHENVISVGERAQQYLPAILEAVRKVEPTGWQQKNGLIYSNPNNLSLISFEAMMGIIEKATKEFVPISEQETPVSGNAMAKEATHHTNDGARERAYTEAPAMA